MRCKLRQNLLHFTNKKNEMHYINKNGIVLFSEGTGRVLSTFFLNNLFENLIQKAYFEIFSRCLFSSFS